MSANKGPMPIFPRRTVVEAIRETLVAQVHFADVLPAPGHPTTLRIEGPGALNGAAFRAVVGHERALEKAGFRLVECLGVDPEDPRGRHGRARAAVPAPGAPWQWDRVSGEELQARLLRGDELQPAARSAEPERVAAVLPLAPRRARARR